MGVLAMTDTILDRINAGERFPILLAFGHMIRCVDEAVNSQKELDADKLVDNYKPLVNNTKIYHGIERRRQTGAVC